MSEKVKKLELKKKAKKPMIFVTNVLNSNLTILQKGKKKKKNEIKKAASSKTQIIQPEDENSGRKLTSQSSQSLTMPSSIGTSPAQISFTSQ